MTAADDFVRHMQDQDPNEGYDPFCPLPRPHGHHWNGLGRGLATERECHGEPHTPKPDTEETS